MRQPARLLALLALTAALAVGACNRDKAQPPAPAPPPDPLAATAISDFSQDMTALGTEPFWNLTIRGLTFTLTRPDQPPVTGMAPGAVITPGQASWSVPVGTEQGMKVTLSISECSDGMSDNRYPMTAEVDVGGTKLLGCAAKAAEMPREGG